MKLMQSKINTLINDNEVFKNSSAQMITDLEEEVNALKVNNSVTLKYKENQLQELESKCAKLEAQVQDKQSGVEFQEELKEAVAKAAYLEAQLKDLQEEYRLSDACCRTVVDQNDDLKKQNRKTLSILDVTQKVTTFCFHSPETFSHGKKSVISLVCRVDGRRKQD